MDPSVLSRALADANLAVLVSAVAHLTGDLTLVDRYRDPRLFDHGRGPGTLPPEEAEAIRAEAFAVLADLDHPVQPATPTIDDASLHRIMEFCAGEEIAPDYVRLVEEEANFDGLDRRRFVWTRRPTEAVLARFHVGIIGAGLGGLCAAIRLEQAGIPYTVFEKDAEAGGTWFENTYPDLRVDVPNHFYSYSFFPNPDWSHYYARQDELLDYIARCAKEYAVLPNVRFETEVQDATFDDARGTWSLRLRGPGDTEDHVEVNALISAVGMLNRPSIPDIDGLDSFDGPCFHSARWNHDVELRGQRVAVIGTGASAMHVVPAIAPEVERLAIFQRSRHWVMPNPNYHRAVTDGEKWLFHNVPHYAGWYRFLMFWNSSDRMYPAFRVDPTWPDRDRSISKPNDKLRRIMTAHLEQELAASPDLVAKVLPDYPALGKRILQDNGWFRALLRSNVELVTDRIARVEPHSVVTASGDSYDADAVILATGFHPNKYLWPMKIIGREAALHDEWGEDPRAYLGITMPGFPNLFCLYGPNTNPVVGSVIFVLECQVDYIVRAIGAMVERGYATMECRRDVHDAYNERVDAEHEQLVWRHPRVHSYYNNSTGRVTTNAPWKLIDYWQMTKEPALDDFVLRRGGS
ncbi:MAG: NAD(P)/FAD-dependent oxidoreductase [Acidimicrobiia bacterium]